MHVPHWAVIPSRSRLSELTSITNQLLSEDVNVVIIDNGYPEGTLLEPDVFATSGASLVIKRDTEQPPNISRLWNVGLDVVSQLCNDNPHNVAILNDDALLPRGWYYAVSTALRSYDVVAACSSPHKTISNFIVSRSLDDNLLSRMCPWAFMLRGEVGLRADENLRWWWGDTDIDWRARLAGGLVTIPGYRVENLHANSTTVGALALQTKKDRETFRLKWGRVPW